MVAEVTWVSETRWWLKLPEVSCLRDQGLGGGSTITSKIKDEGKKESGWMEGRMDGVKDEERVYDRREGDPMWIFIRLSPWALVLVSPEPVHPSIPWPFGASERPEKGS
ncbi:hypothetical protein DPEC_G00060140 [Dallia pectoralis]|uniref:Uncharacterized protein n=1 Tax=Dallia pectoralis TaxID=75939 RepID=A0ACC2H7W9_DALPE|nr:hypothetical protein DPEC_G00060140 [Dallia pectoralis]